MDTSYDYLFKILIVGDSGVGKSALLFKFTDNEFLNTSIPTIGVDFRIKTIFLNNKYIKLQLWDTAGQERFRSIISSYYRGAHGVLILFDLTSHQSFINVEKWIKDTKMYCSDNTKYIIVGTKCDMITKIEVSDEEINYLIEKCSVKYIKTSSRSGINIDNSFNTIAEEISKDIVILKSNENKNIITINNKNNTSDNLKKSCC